MKFKFCVSGAAETDHCPPDIKQTAEVLGKALAQHGIVTVNGATTGFPLFVAKGAKEAGGFVIGISPAETEKEHKERYQLPLDYLDMIVYTGFGYSGRNLLLTRSADAVIVGCGRMGTLNEFTIAFEDNKPIGVLTNAGGTTDLIEQIIKESRRGGETPVIFESDPAILVEKLINIIGKHKHEYLE